MSTNGEEWFFLARRGDEGQFIVYRDKGFVLFRELWAGVSQGTRQLTFDEARKEWRRLIAEGYRQNYDRS